MVTRSRRLGRRSLLKAAVTGAAAIGASAGAAALAEAGEPKPRATVFRDVRLFDGRRVRQRATVVVVGGRIAAVASDPDFSDGARVIDGRGRTLLPGLIDAHMHDAGVVPRTDPPRFGVTTELDMFNFIDRLEADLGDYKTRRRSYRPTDTADLWSAGAMITVPGGHGSQMDLPEDFPWLEPGMDPAAHVDDRLAEGSDYVKFVVDPIELADPWPTVGREQAEAIVRRARERDVLSLAHVSMTDDAVWLMATGVDGLIHVPQSARFSAGQLSVARDWGGFVTGTLSIYRALATDPVSWDIYRDERIAPLLSTAQREVIATRYPPDFPGDPLDREIAAANIAALHEAGVPILAGTDSATPGLPNGIALLVELELLVEAGLEPVAALSAATAAPAEHFGLHDRGRVAVGRRADLVLVDGDPTRDITAMRGIERVWRNGAEIDRTAMD